MARPHVEFVQSLHVEPRAVATGAFAGAVERLLSEDPETGASTATLAIPGGWSNDVGGSDRPVELFVLRGDLELAGRPFPAGCYAHLPAGSTASQLATERGADVLAMVDDPAPASDQPLLIADTGEMRWVASSIAAVPPGLVNKRLRQDPQSGERTWVAACPPGWMEERAEIHPTVEEALMLSGDLLLGTRGAMTPGCYFWRPPMVPHGPMYTRSGAQFFFRTKGGTLEVEYETVPEWDRLVSEYRDEQPLFTGWAGSAADHERRDRA
jgi:hypothetical protein